MACLIGIAALLFLTLGPVPAVASGPAPPAGTTRDLGAESHPVVADSSPIPVPGEILVRFRRDLRRPERDAALRTVGAARLHRFDFIDVDHVRVAEGTLDQALAQLRDDPRVLYAEPNWQLHTERTPDDPLFPQQYSLHNTGQTGGVPGADIGARHAWDVFTGDSTLRIGMIDSGIDYTHPDLAANVWTNPGEIPGNGQDDDGDGYVDDIHGYDFANNDGDPMDDNGHGTHTAGTVAAVGDNAIGVSGVAWRAQLIAIKFLNASGSGSVSGAIQALQYAIAVHCRLTSNSWGGGGSSQALLDAIDAAGAAGQLFVAAAGNSHHDIDSLGVYPASFDTPYVLAVAATDDHDSLASFSNFGPTKVGVAAPGVSILSTLPGNRYGTLSGTSMACPHVAGVVALALGRFPSLDPLAVKALILAGADRLPQLLGLVSSGGRLDAFGAVSTPDSTPPGAIGDVTVGEVGSNTIELSWTATGDDSTDGRASRYDVRTSNSPITPESWGSATPAAGTPEPLPAGSPERFTVTGLSFSSPYWLAMRALDEFGNAGPISNVVTATTLGVPRLRVSPDSIGASANTGSVAVATLTLANTAQGTLDFSIPTPAIAFAAPPAPPPVPDAKGEGGPAGIAVTAHSGGPDAFGYRWIDSDTTAGPRFEWTDITGIGTQLLLDGDDNLSGLIPLGFQFPFYGTNFDSLRVCTNGFVTFNDLLPFYSNQPLPSTAAPANAVMPLWDDLNFGASRRAWVWGNGSRFIIEYVGVPHYQSGGPYTFEVVLDPSGTLHYEYLSLGPPTGSATVGLQDGARRVGLQVAFNGAYLHDSLAIKLVPIRQWAQVTPGSGRVFAGDSLALSVRFDAAGLTGGDYHARIELHTNDPAAPSVSVPLAMQVIGAPDLEVAPAALDFGDVYVGARALRTLSLRNPGTDVLNVGPVGVSDSTLRADASSFSLLRFQQRELGVAWSPADSGAFSATLTLPSNDPDLPLTSVPLTGRALPAPSVAASPDSLAARLATGASSSALLHVANRGAGDYIFRATPLSSVAAVAVESDANNQPVGKGAADVVHGPTARSLGGPDGFGYTFRDSHEGGGPAFRWEDVRGSGAAVALTGDDAISAPLPLAFDFPYYGQSFRSLRVATNGFVSFTGTGTAFSNTSLPNQGAGVPENLLAAFWDDLVFPADHLAWFYSDADHAVVQFQGVPRFGEPANPNTFEIVVDSAGGIEYRYLELKAQNLSSATVGIQNGARDDGLQVAFNAPYLGDSLALRFSRPPRWLTVTPDTARIPPGGALDLSVGFHAAGLFGGSYDGRVQLDGNDPLAPTVRVPAHLAVDGVPSLVVPVASLDFGRVSIGEPRARPLRIENAGSDTLRISKLATSDAHYVAFPDHFDLAPFSARDVEVTLAPDRTGPISAALVVRSNDPLAPEHTLALEGSGAEPPSAVVADQPIHAALAPSLGPRAMEVTRTLGIGNRGGNDLTFSARALPGPGTNSEAAPVDAEEAKGSAGALGADGLGVPGALGSGGPDGGGYRWLDNDEPGAPAFDWIDISASGQPIALAGDDQLSAPLPLPFAFPFYGSRFDSIRVCTNGFATFTSSLATFTNTPLPNAGSIVPENLLAVFWDDQDFRPASGAARALIQGDSSRVVIAFLDVPHLTVGGPYNYEIVLHRGGDIDYQYLQMGTRLTEATIGLQNGDKSTGVQVAFNAGYVRDHLRVRFTRRPPWLAVTPDSGVTPPGGGDSLRVGFSAAGYPDGDLAGSLRIETNDLRSPVRQVPVTLHIGVTPARARVTTRALAISSADRTAHLSLTLPGVAPGAFATATLRVNDTLAVSRDPTAAPSDSAAFRVDVLDLLRPLGGSELVPLAVSGLAEGVTWFAATDTVRLSRPTVTSPAGLKPYGAGSPRVDVASDGGLDVAWDAPLGIAVDTWELWSSSDAGAKWTELAHGLSERSWVWVGPALVDSAMIEVVGRNGAVPVSAFISDPFRLTPADTLNGGIPTRFALALRGSNPAFGSALFRLAVPRATTVDVRVFDVGGAQVRTLVRGALPAGYRWLPWDLQGAGGRSVAPGVYFVRAESEGRISTSRVVVLR